MNLHLNADCRNERLDNLQRKYDMKIISNYKSIDPNKLFFDRQYQRVIQPQRVSKISESIKKYGYWPELIFITEDYRVIDGQHRAKAAINCNINFIPVCIVKFKSKESEARFFVDKNNWNTKLKPVEFWYAKYLSKHPVALMIYSLEEDLTSPLYNKISLKGKETDKSKFLLDNVLIMIATVCLDISDTWSVDRDDKYTSMCVEIGYEIIKNKLAVFLDWFTKIWGNDKRSNPVPFRRESLRAILMFYMLLKRQGFNLKQSVIKMQSFLFTADFIKNSQSGKTMALVNHFNAGKRKKLNYE